MSEDDSELAKNSRPSHMRGSAAPEHFEALYRPPKGFNRVVIRALDWRRPRSLRLEDLGPWVRESLRAFTQLRAQPQAVTAVAAGFPRRWRIADTPAPKDVWCGEVVFANGEEPLVLMYPDSPWGRMPRFIFESASQAGVDHMVAHLLEYYSGADYGEEAACRDQVRLMLTRRRGQDTAMAAAIAVGHRLHKGIPLRIYAPAVRERYRSPAQSMVGTSEQP